MLTVHQDHIGDVAVLECDGPIVGGDDASELEGVVTAREEPHVIVLDLTGVNAIDGLGLRTLQFLKRLTTDHNIHLKLFNPHICVRYALEHLGSACKFEIVSLHSAMTLLTDARRRQQPAA